MSERGRKDACTLGEYLCKNNINFDYNFSVDENYKGLNYNNVVTSLNFNPIKLDFSFVQDIYTYGVNPKNIKTRYIKVKATNINECPEYHPGSGGPSWIFSDEIIIN